MLFDVRLKSIAKFAQSEKEPSREQLSHVFFEKGVSENSIRAIATDGHVLAFSEFKQDMISDYPVYATQVPDDKFTNPFCISAGTILQAFKNVPVKHYLPILNMLSIHSDGMFSEMFCTDMKAPYLTSFNDKYKYNELKPRYQQVIPTVPVPTEKIRVDLHFLKLLYDISNGDKSCKFTFHGNTGAMGFKITVSTYYDSEAVIEGIICPLRNND